MLQRTTIHGHCLELSNADFPDEWKATWNDLTVCTVGKGNSVLFREEYAVTEWGVDQVSTSTPYYYKSMIEVWRHVCHYLAFEFWSEYQDSIVKESIFERQQEELHLQMGK